MPVQCTTTSGSGATINGAIFTAIRHRGGNFVAVAPRRRKGTLLLYAPALKQCDDLHHPAVDDRGEPGKYLLLERQLRVEALKDLDETNVACLISTDDEAFTCNLRVNRIAIVQEHKMILKARERGVSEERLTRALNVNVAEIRRKRHPSRHQQTLKGKNVPIYSFVQLRKLAPRRQIEAVELMAAMNWYSISYAKSPVAATPQDQLADRSRPKAIEGLTEAQRALMQRKSASLDRPFKMAERSHGATTWNSSWQGAAWPRSSTTRASSAT